MSTIAVVIPCYNGWKYMNKCLSSLENQTILPEEVIVVDDCSTDDSYERLLEYKKQSVLNIKVLRNEKNSGPSLSREYAVKNAKSEYVVFCDCDDWYETCFIEKIKKVIADKNSDFVMFDNFDVYGEKKSPADVIKRLIGKNKNELIALSLMSLWRIVVSKKCLEKVKFPNLYYSEDGVVLLQLIDNAENITLIDEPFYNYYYRESSASKRLSKRAYEDSVKAFCILEEYFHNKYPQECEYLGIKYFLYSSVVIGLKSGTPSGRIKTQIKDFFKKYPRWYKNKYLYDIGKGKMLYLYILRARLFFLFPIMAKLHTVIVILGEKNRTR